MQVEEEVHEEQPAGQIIDTPPTTALPKLVEGLFTQALLESTEYPLLQTVHTIADVQVRQLSEQATQTLLETK